MSVSAGAGARDGAAEVARRGADDVPDGVRAFLVVRHEADCNAGHLYAWARAAGAELRLLSAHDGEPVPTRVPDDVAGLIVLGGDMGAHDDAAHPWLTPTKALLADAFARGVPTLGVCLGHQLLAVALGGEVRRAPHGAVCDLVRVDVEAVQSGDPSDPVFGALPAGAPALRWNRDVVVAPPAGARVLARDGVGAPLVARFGPAAWGLQVHPEAVPDEVAGWGGAPADLIARLRAADADVLAAWAPAMTAFFRLPRGGRADGPPAGGSIA